MTITTTTTTECPSWCTTEHERPGGFHRGPDVSPSDALAVWHCQVDGKDCQPRIIVAGQAFTEAQAHELGLALVRAADVLRRGRMEANR